MKQSTAYFYPEYNPLTRKEKKILSDYWQMPIRCNGQKVEAKKRGTWGILYFTLEEARKNIVLLKK